MTIGQTRGISKNQPKDNTMTQEEINEIFDPIHQSIQNLSLSLYNLNIIEYSMRERFIQDMMNEALEVFENRLDLLKDSLSICKDSEIL